MPLGPSEESSRPGLARLCMYYLCTSIEKVQQNNAASLDVVKTVRSSDGVTS